ncbi:MAG: hypothetical protein K8R21_15190, partial [Leptospira sp.]|nr:hypothetical protein [Leptospira sp.]
RGTIFQFREELPVDIPILTWLGANSRIFSIPNPLILYFSTYPFDQLFAEFASKEGCILSNESLNLAGIAKSLSLFLNKKKLTLLGTSFLAKNGKTHCRGTGYENYRIPYLGRKQTMEGYIPRIYGKKLSHKNKLAYDKLMSQQGELIVENFSEMNTAVTLQNKYLPVQLKFNQEADAEIVERFSVNLPSFLYDPVFAGRVSEELSLNKPVINRLRKLICKE